jgi:serine/threonine-protein kinase
MATVYLGSMETTLGVPRTVAIKRVHPHIAGKREFAAMFFDEARLSIRIQHPNVVPTFDVVAEAGELLLVMDYVHGGSLSALLRAGREWGELMPPRIASGIMVGVLAGLHAAHDLKGPTGVSLDIVHRDVSPQNILVGVDGVARVLDFGVAKAVGRVHTTEDGSIRGKIAYMAPEQLVSGPIDRRVDVFAASIVLWEALTGERLFHDDAPGRVVAAVMSRPIALPSVVNPSLDPAIDPVVMLGLSRDRDTRYATAEDLAAALERVILPASPREIGDWVKHVASDLLAERAAMLLAVEAEPTVAPASVMHPPVGTNEVPSEEGSIPLPHPLIEQAATLGSTTLPLQASPPANRLRPWLVAGVASLGVAAVALQFGGSTARSSASTAPPMASAPTEPPPGPATIAATMAPATSEPAEPPPAASAQAAPLRSLPKRAPRARGAPHAPAASAASTPSPPPPGSAARCANPFVVNSQGFRVPRPECF